MKISVSREGKYMAIYDSGDHGHILTEIDKWTRRWSYIEKEKVV
jgi:hypothetical protein